MRFVNWLENGQNEGEIERGTYAIGTGVSEARAEDAKYFIPTDEEWYKAPFYDPTLADGAGGYWKYATQSNSFLTFERPAGGTNSVNTAESKVGGTTEVGAYTNSTSYYGTFDQTGNVGEWTETIVQSGDLPAGRRKRLPSWGDSVFFVTSGGTTLAGRYDRAAAAPFTGFRVARRAMIPGDADLDGEFNSSDFTKVFQVGKYESDDPARWN